MAGDLFTADTAPKSAPAGSENNEILLAQGPITKGRSLADEIVNDRRPPATTPPADTRPATPPAGGDKTPPPAAPRDVPAATTDGTDVVLKLSYTDPKFGEKIWNTVRYNKLEITDFPRGASIQHWQDKNGDFFYLTDAAGKMLDGKLHYYPGNLSKITINGNTQDVNAQRVKVREAIARRNDIDVLDGVLTLSYKDPNFDRKIFQTDVYDTINLKDLPPGAKFTHGLDNNGFYFDVGDGKKHYYPKNLKQLAVDGKATADMTRTRMEVVEKYAKDNFGGLPEFTRQRDNFSNAQQVMMFGFKMDKEAAKALDVLDKGLTDAIQHSATHPYFKYLLANVKLGKAMGAVRERVLAGQPINHPSVLDNLDKCDELLDQVIKESDGSLRRGGGRFPRPNAPLLPLAPYAPYDPRNPDGYYQFWGGTYDQAGFMKPGIALIRGLVEANALGLPPARPER